MPAPRRALLPLLVVLAALGAASVGTNARSLAAGSSETNTANGPIARLR